MANVKIPRLVGKTNKRGITNWYWQPSKTLADAGWTTIPLGNDMGAAIAGAEVKNREVDVWKSGGARPDRVKPRIEQGTFSALIALYRKDRLNARPGSGHRQLSPKTIETYETSLKRLDVWAGKHPVAFITAARVSKLRDACLAPVEDGGLGHSATFNLLKTLRQVLAFGERKDWLPKGSNPATNFELGAPPARRKVWELDDEAAFIAAAYDLGLPSMALAIELALYSAQREGDLIAFTEPQLQPLEIHEPTLHDRLAGDDGQVMGWCFSQAKTSNEDIEVAMEIPLEPGILAKVQAAIRNNRARDRAATPPRLLTHVLVNDRTGLPWKKRHFISTWTKICDHAATTANRPGMRDLVWHDLRRTRVVRLRRRGMAKEMIAAITGHSYASITAMLKVYGPIDPTITANAIASTLPPKAAQPATTVDEAGNDA